MPTFTPSDWIAMASGTVSLTALFVALYAIGRSNRNSSVATLVAMNQSFRQAWQRYLAAAETAKDHEFSELANMLEIACGIHWEKSLFGISRELPQEYIEHVMLLIEDNLDARRRLEKAIHAPTTFKYIRCFRAEMHKRQPTLGKIL